MNNSSVTKIIKSENFIVGIGCLIFTMAMYSQLGVINTEARLFPKYIISILLILSLFLIVEAIFKGLKGEVVKSQKFEGELRGKILTLVSLIVYFILISKMGTFVTTYLFVLFTFVFASKKINKQIFFKGGVFSFLLTVFLYIMFRIIMKVPVPSGIFL